MSGFDIKALNKFTPPRWSCKRCRALHSSYEFRPELATTCSVCGVRYLETEACDDFRKYASDSGLWMSYADSISHARKLASVAERFEAPQGVFSPIVLLLEALHAAEHFVHFVSWNITLPMIGALRLRAVDCKVRGVVSLRDDSSYAARELEASAKELHDFEVRTEQGWDAPHQKLIVIDGLLALTGSANLTENAWRKAGEGGEIVEVVTDVDKVTELHNRYFSPLWRKGSDVGDIVEMAQDAWGRW